MYAQSKRLAFDISVLHRQELFPVPSINSQLNKNLSFPNLPSLNQIASYHRTEFFSPNSSLQIASSISNNQPKSVAKMIVLLSKIFMALSCGSCSSIYSFLSPVIGKDVKIDWHMIFSLKCPTEFTLASVHGRQLNTIVTLYMWQEEVHITK